MFSTQPPLLPLGSASSRLGANTGNPDQDCWAENSLDIPVKSSLQQIPQQERNKLVFVVMTKYNTGVITGSPSIYLQGCIKKYLNEQMGKFGTGGYAEPGFIHVHSHAGVSPGGSARTGPYDRFGADGRAAVDQVATPQRAAIAAPERHPPWVCQAWELRDQRTALFRKVSQHVPVEAMEAIGELPGPWQLICLQVVLLDKKHYQDPVSYMRSFAASYNGMPTSVSSMPAGVAAPRGMGRPVAVMHLGKCNGFELSSLFLSTERLLADGHQVHISDMVIIDNDYVQNSEDEAWMGANDPRASVTRISAADAPRVVEAKAQQWQAEKAVVVIAMVAPKAVPAGLPIDAQAPGYHAGGAKDVWGYYHIMKILTRTLPRAGVVVFTPDIDQMETSDHTWFNRHFGQPMKIEHTQGRIPQSGWHFRCGPAAVAKVPTVRRAGENPESMQLDPELQAAADPCKPYTAVLPDLIPLEQLVEKRSNNENLTDAEVKKLNLVLKRASNGKIEEPLMFLDRKQLGYLFGLHGWRACEAYNDKHPCSGYIHSFTGQRVAVTMPGAIACGQLKFCNACSQLYDSIASTPNAFLCSHGVAVALEQSHFCTDSRRGGFPRPAHASMPSRMPGAMSVSPLRAQQAALLRHASFESRAVGEAARALLCATGKIESSAVGS